MIADIEKAALHLLIPGSIGSLAEKIVKIINEVEEMCNTQ